MVTSAAVSVLGAVLTSRARWAGFATFCRMRRMKRCLSKRRVAAIEPVRREVAHAEVGEDLKRAWLPLEIHPISAGIKGGLAGSVAMALLAMLYGLVSGHSIWYPINLLVAGFFPSSVTQSTAQLAAFHFSVLLIAIPIHLHHVADGRVAVWGDAADASATSDSAGRLYRAGHVVRPDLRSSRHRESGAQSAHRLVAGL